MERLEQAFLGCEKLQEHMRFLLSKGGLYKVHNGNLLYHGCVPLNADGSFRKVRIFDQVFQGKSLYDALERYVRKGFFCDRGSGAGERKRHDVVYLAEPQFSVVRKR